MLNKKLDRRSAVKSVLAISGFGLVATSFVGKALLGETSSSSLLPAQLTPAEQYIFDIVAKNGAEKRRFNVHNMVEFSQDFVAVLGQKFDYKSTFPPILGEIEIMRCFNLHVV